MQYKDIEVAGNSVKNASVMADEPGQYSSSTAIVESWLPTVNAINSKVVGLNGAVNRL